MSNAVKPLTSTERSKARRERLKAAGLPEVRGIHAHPEDHPEIKQAAARISAKGAKKRRKAQGESNE